jgi:protein involved in polysaccharide export with SLBB domain
MTIQDISRRSVLLHISHELVKLGAIATLPVAAMLPLGGCGSDPDARATSELAVPETEYQLGTGDKVRVVVFGQPELTGEYLVDGKGNMAFPLVGSLEAGGVTARQLEKNIAGKLSPGYLNDPKVAVEVLSYRPFYVLGEVKSPGSYSYVNGMSVVNAVALAGGFTYRAKTDGFYITRGGNGGRQKYLAQQDTPLMPGDVITVRERYF